MATEKLVLQPFATALIWKEFAGSSTTLFEFGGAAPVNIASSRVGTFGQFGLGVAGQVVGTPVIGFLRADLRTGTNIQGY